ncbi:lysophospholipid acyltransferase family protein [Deinococcus aerophilus]|uniref:Phospholipid/glycerol acyltransferase domain-containing protein n=1 Tax=Deinococcus aerophilus TaxID=522488 RepID=A0ABQ2GJQ4_9DEIO|nr:lysophospholipid acyltransferase family protein [Deinococcus aerophilus]GGL99018.1 hypothetical protein GCM10010841_04410 [Deinococcus aerophilus]
MRGASRLPAHLNPAQRQQFQRRLGERFLRHLDVHLQVRGTGNIGAGPYLVASLHEGIADVLCLLRLPLPLRFVARREIFGWPAIGPALQGLGHVSINPEHPLGGFRGLWRSAETILAGGESLVVFPQGTVAGIQSDFQRGGFEVARRVGVPILPVAITGTHRVWEHPFSPTLRYGQAVTVQVLPAISVEEIRDASLDALRVRTRRALKAAALAPGMPPARFFEPERDGYWDGYRLDIDPDFPELARRMAEHRAALLRDAG